MQRITTCALATAIVALACAMAPVRVARAFAADAPGASAGAPAGAPAVLSPESGTLKNGLRVLTLTDPHAAVSTFQVWYDTGSRNERPGITGISQLVEALMFQGTKTVGANEFVRRIQAVGGVADGQTTNDVTEYWEAVTPDQLDLVARLEADRMANLAITPVALDSAKAAVRRLRRQNVESSQLGRGLELLNTLTYDANPYRWPVTGWPHEMGAITVDEARDWYATRYTPDKALVVIAGPSSHADNMRLVEKWFGGLKPGRPAPRTAFDERPQYGARTGTLEDPTAPFPLLIVGYKTPPDSSADGPVMDVITRLLGGGAVSRLSASLVDADRLAYFASAANAGRKDVGLFYAMAGLKAGSDRDSLAGALCAEIEGLAEANLSEDDLARARNELETQFWFGLDELQDRASAVASAALVDGDPLALGRRVERWRAVTRDDVARVARSYLTASNRTSVWVVLPARRSS